MRSCVFNVYALFARRECKLDTVISQDCMDFVGKSLDHDLQEGGCRVAVGFVLELNKNKL